MNVSIEPVPEFTPQELELVVAVLVDGLDAATMTCAARTCAPVVGAAADGEAVVADAVAALVPCAADDAVGDSEDVPAALG